ncbi:helix-turn-helix domain-containing protein [Streptomyces bobili]|uniref:helix-turn-helix domain-containing protein n=1 Tax=Streptomyces bobili TaxID=67280 RepID=UPI0037F1C89A
MELFTVDGSDGRPAGGSCDIGRGAAELVVALQYRGSGTISRGDGEVTLKAGDFVIFEAVRPFDVRSEGHVVCFVVPRHALGLSSPELRRLTRETVRGDQGLGALVSSFLSELAAEGAHWAPEVGERLAGKAMDLLAGLFAERLTHHQDGGAESDAPLALPGRIKSFITENLADPDLTPESIARAHHISVRYLHKLFQDEELTVGRLIQRRRLEKCREELGRGGRPGPGVSAVAQRWGFSHPTQFARAFRAAYGMSPSTWQARAHDADATG